jgi:hypothetical protein
MAHTSTNIGDALGQIPRRADHRLTRSILKLGLENIELKKAIYDVLNDEFEKRGAKKSPPATKQAASKTGKTLNVQ